MNIIQRSAVIWFLLMLSAFISGCGPGQLLGPTVTPTATATASPTPTPAPTPILPGSISIPDEIYGTTIHIDVFDMAKAGLKAPAGHRGVGVVGTTDSDPSLPPVSWEVSLRDAAGNTYNRAPIEVSGQVKDAPKGTIYFEWYFDPIPDTVKKLWLVLPGGAKVDITVLLEHLK